MRLEGEFWVTSTVNCQQDWKMVQTVINFVLKKTKNRLHTCTIKGMFGYWKSLPTVWIILYHNENMAVCYTLLSHEGINSTVCSHWFYVGKGTTATWERHVFKQYYSNWACTCIVVWLGADNTSQCIKSGGSKLWSGSFWTGLHVNVSTCTAFPNCWWFL